MELIVTFYEREDGRRPFEDWYDSLRDTLTKRRIRARLHRLESGNWGDARALGRELHELRLDFGPGYRLYFGRHGSRIVVMLLGGDKSTQARDIEKARACWLDYLSRRGRES